jgi:similar to spore coat protein
MTILGSIAHIAGLSDQVIASDFLVSVKSAIQNYGIAITEVTSADLRQVLKRQLNDAIDTHAVVSAYMIDKGYYHAYDIPAQKEEVLKVTKTALELYESKK